MKKQETEQTWWKALGNWLERYQGRADFLFVYDRSEGRLDRCFDRNVMLNTVDVKTVSRLYQAAEEGRLGLLRPNDLKPQLLTTDPEKIVAPEKAAAAPKMKEKEQPSAEVKREEPAKPVAEPMLKLDADKLERAAADPAKTARMRAAEAQYRQVMYVPKAMKEPAPTETGENSAVRLRVKQAAALEQAREMLRDVLPPEQQNEQNQLVMDLAQMMLNLGDGKKKDDKQTDWERRAREELIAAQNLFIWAAASEKRDEELYDTHMEHLEQADKLMLESVMKWHDQLMDMTRALQRMDMKGMSEEMCGEKIRDFLDGKAPEPQEEQGELQPLSGEMLGSTLRHFCRFAASEVPLSMRHVQVGEQCRRILQEAKEIGIPEENLGLDPQELMAVHGTMEMGSLVEQGLLAQAALTSGQRMIDKQYRTCLQSYLAMKAMEEALIPHVEAHQQEINANDGPISALQIVMANPGFRADDLRAKAGGTAAISRLERTDPKRVAQMIREGSPELAAMGLQVMVASYHMADAPVHEPAPPQMSGPAL